YGNLDLTGTTVYGWYTVPRSAAEERMRGRDQKIEDCMAASGLDLSGFYDVMAIYNTQMDLGSWTVTMAGQSVMGNIADNLSPPDGIAHEMGHGLTLDHSLDDTQNTCATWGGPGEYCDRFDIMSAMMVNSFHSTRGPNGCPPADQFTDPCRYGPGLNAWGRYVLGWMPGPRIALWNATG